MNRHENTLKIGQSTNEAARPAKLKRATLHICSALNTDVVNENAICQKLHSKSVGMAFKNEQKPKQQYGLYTLLSSQQNIKTAVAMILASSIYD